MDGPKIKRRDLKQDKVYVTMAGVANFCVRHRFQMAVGVCAVLAVFALIYFHSISAQRRATEASLALYKAEKIEDSAEKSEALRKVSQEFAGTPAAAMAKFELADFFYEERKYEEARVGFDEFLKSYPNHSAAPAAMEALGFCLESVGHWKEAANEYERLKKSHPAHPAAKRVMYRLGLCYERLGETNKAIDAYNRTAELLPDSLWAEYANERIVFLTGKSPSREPAAEKE